MKPIILALITITVVSGRGVASDAPANRTERVVDIKSPDGITLKANYFAAAKPGPGVLLLHQVNRTRKSWEQVAQRLADSGISTLTLDIRGIGESGGTRWEPMSHDEAKRIPDDIDAALKFLMSQPEVNRDVIGLGGAGVIGVLYSVEAARRHPDATKSLVLMSGETRPDGRRFLRQASQLPELFVADDNDEYPPIVEGMELLYVTASSPSRKLVHYSAAHEAPWRWYEPVDVGKVPASGGHGTDMFKGHPELRGIIVDWFVTTLIKTPGHAPADTVSSASVINQIQTPGGVAQVTQQLIEARRKDPAAQLFPEITVSTIGQDHMRAGDNKSAINVLQLLLAAYPESADAHETIAEAYLADGQKDLARQHAGKALAILDTRNTPASSWTNTNEYRGEIRRGAEKVLKSMNEKPQ